MMSERESRYVLIDERVHLVKRQDVFIHFQTFQLMEITEASNAALFALGSNHVEVWHIRSVDSPGAEDPSTVFRHVFQRLNELVLL
jgi:hypothetical protein